LHYLPHYYKLLNTTLTAKYNVFYFPSRILHSIIVGITKNISHTQTVQPTWYTVIMPYQTHNSDFSLMENRQLTLRRRIKSHLLFAGIIRSSPFSPRWQGKG